MRHLSDPCLQAAAGVALCLAVTAAAFAGAWAEQAWLGRAWLEALVLAILVGTMLRTCWRPPDRWAPGISFCARFLLELAVALLGAAVSPRLLMAGGAALPAVIAGVVVAAIAAGYGIGRVLGLPHRMAMLVACGNAICGNSAIAAVAPVIGAVGEDVAAAIGFTAVLGVGVVLALPVLAAGLGLSAVHFGQLAGLTVYAVPQVLAATAPAGAIAVQTGTLVKLVRVLMLGPVVLGLSLLGSNGRGARPPIAALAPWFILAFLGLAGLRAAGLLPAALLPEMSSAASALTVVSMAALGLGTDLRCLARAGARVTAAVMLSLIALGGLAGGAILLLA